MSSEPSDRGLEPRLVTLVAVELVGGAHLFERLPPAAARAAVERHDAVLRGAAARHGGREIEKTRRFLLLFERPFEAVRCCLDYHRELAAADRDEGILRGRAAVHLGEAYLWANAPEDVRRYAKPLEVEGQARTDVSRLLALATAGRTLLTQGAFEVARRAAVGEQALRDEVEWLDHGAYDFGSTAPLEVFEVRQAAAGPGLGQPPALEEVRRAAPLSPDTAPWRPMSDAQLPQRPRWRLHRRVEGEAGDAVEIWLLRHAKSGEWRISEISVEEPGRARLRLRVAALRRLRQVAGARPDLERVVEWDLDAAPYFVEIEPAAPLLAAWAAERGGLEAIDRDQRLRLAARICAGLASAHAAGVFHGRISPDAVRVGGDLEPLPVVVGFGRHETEDGVEDCRAVGDLVFRLAVGDLDQPPGPFWRRSLDDSVLERVLEGLLEPDPRRRVDDLEAVADRLARLDELRAAWIAEKSREKAFEQAAEMRTARRWSLGILAAVVLLVILLVLAWSAGRGATEDAPPRKEIGSEKSSGDDRQRPVGLYRPKASRSPEPLGAARRYAIRRQRLDAA